MGAAPQLLLAASALWAAAALAAQAVRVRGAARRPFSAPAGSASRGVLYSFTGAMAPHRKESASRHPVAFAAGAVLHLAVFAAFAATLAAAVAPERSRSIAAGAPLAALGLAACVGLFLRRLLRPTLRAVSSPEDFSANLVVAALLAANLAHHAGWLNAAALQVIAALVLIYLPLGKLRHGLFFFLSRINLGRRLGRRGVYPPVRGAEARRGRV